MSRWIKPTFTCPMVAVQRQRPPCESQLAEGFDEDKQALLTKLVKAQHGYILSRLAIRASREWSNGCFMQYM